MTIDVPQNKQKGKLRLYQQNKQTFWVKWAVMPESKYSTFFILVFVIYTLIFFVFYTFNNADVQPLSLVDLRLCQYRCYHTVNSLTGMNKKKGISPLQRLVALPILKVPDYYLLLLLLIYESVYK